MGQGADFRWVGGLRALKHIDLTFNNLSIASLTGLAEFTSSLPALELVDLSGNAIAVNVRR